MLAVGRPPPSGRAPATSRVEERSTSMERDDPAYGGQSEYTPFFLKIYDPVVLGFFTRVVWRCPTTRLIEGYRRHVRPLHLDVGPGTGYFLEPAGLPDGSPVTILDPNTNVLAHATRRLQRLDITAVEADVCKPLPITGPFDSAALSGVIHCLPDAQPEGWGDRQRSRRSRTRRRPLWCIDPWDIRTTHPVGTGTARRQLPAGGLRQPGDTEDGSARSSRQRSNGLSSRLWLDGHLAARIRERSRRRIERGLALPARAARS